MADGPSVEQNVWGPLQSLYPGQVQMLGPDVMASGADGYNLQVFRGLTGLSFPLLRDCADGTSDTNLVHPYIQRENYVVINKQGIVRYNAVDIWDFGERLHPSEIRGTVDSLVSHNSGVGGPRAFGWALAASPNPARGPLVLELANPTAGSVRARVTVLDLSGRRIVELPETLAESGFTRVFWDGRGAGGEKLPAGLYLVQAELGSVRLSRRVAITR
jgi:hypothetical protein